MTRIRKTLVQSLPLSILLGAWMHGDAAANGDQQNWAAVSGTIPILVSMFVIALMIEQALSLVFNWRIYRIFYNKSGTKPIISFLFSLLIAYTFGLDPVRIIFKSLQDGGVNTGLLGSGATVKLSDGTLWLSAMMLAGGSGAINDLLVRLGVRSPIADVPAQPAPPENHAWISVEVKREKAIGEIAVEITPLPPADADKVTVGTIAPQRGWRVLRNALLASFSRVPTYGGRLVEANKPIEVRVCAIFEAGGQPQPTLVWRGTPGERAVLDFYVTV